MPEVPSVVLDCETTGLSPAQGHRMVSLAIIPWPPDRPGLHVALNPDRRCDPAAARVHGLADGFLCRQRRFAEHLPRILELIGGAVVVAHNVAFDHRFLVAELVHARVRPPPLKLVCTMQEFRRRHRGETASLDHAARRYGLDVSARQGQHGAFVDAWIAGQLFSRMVLGHDPPICPAAWPGFDVAD